MERDGRESDGVRSSLNSVSLPREAGDNRVKTCPAMGSSPLIGRPSKVVPQRWSPKGERPPSAAGGGINPICDGRIGCRVGDDARHSVLEAACMRSHHRQQAGMPSQLPVWSGRAVPRHVTVAVCAASVVHPTLP